MLWFYILKAQVFYIQMDFNNDPNILLVLLV